MTKACEFAPVRNFFKREKQNHYPAQWCCSNPRPGCVFRSFFPACSWRRRQALPAHRGEKKHACRSVRPHINERSPSWQGGFLRLASQADAVNVAGPARASNAACMAAKASGPKRICIGSTPGSGRTPAPPSPRETFMSSSPQPGPVWFSTYCPSTCSARPKQGLGTPPGIRELGSTDAPVWVGDPALPPEQQGLVALAASCICCCCPVARHPLAARPSVRMVAASVLCFTAPLFARLCGSL